MGCAGRLCPEGFVEVLADPDPDRAQRAMQAMMGMKKLDLRAMRETADGDTVQ